MSIKQWVHPEAGAAARVVQSVTAALSALPFVRRIGVFGSLADRTDDRWSDVDMFVACDDVERMRWSAADAIRRTKPVLFYRMFSSNGQPAGRYWFVDESPFQKLDVSFHDLDRYDRLCRTGEYMGSSVNTREVYACDAGHPATSPVSPSPLEITSRETEIGSWIYRLLRSIKARCRNTPKAADFERDVAGLATAMDGVSGDMVMGGGRVGELGHRLLRMGQYVGANDRGL
jgi:predicted nucleotidyltransferase